MRVYFTVFHLVQLAVPYVMFVSVFIFFLICEDCSNELTGISFNHSLQWKLAASGLLAVRGNVESMRAGEEMTSRHL